MTFKRSDRESLNEILNLLDKYASKEICDFFIWYCNKHDYYKEIALYGRDSDDARECRMCEDDPKSFIMLDLEEGLDG